MAQLDTYLVEKLREILQRLYPGSQPNAGLFQQQSHSQVEQQQVKRSPSLFPDAPADEMLTESGLAAGGVSASESNSPQPNENSGSDDTYLYSESASAENFDDGALDVGVYKEQFPLSNSNQTETFTYGVEVNCSTSPAETSFNKSFANSVLLKSDNESSALTRNLHEFIHILKMSLQSGSTFPSPGHDDLNNRYHKSTIHSDNFGVSKGDTSVTDPFSGIEAASTTDMEFNLTLDDILDLNNLLAGDTNTSGLPVKHILIIATYFIIACVSIIGNLLVVQLVIRSRRFHTLTHALLANLAAADLFLATFNIPFSAARVILSEWPFGSFLCRTVPFVQVTSVYATSFTMAVIAIDRYQVIMNPLGKRLKCSQGILLVIAIWIVSGVLSLPYALNHQVVTVLTVRVVKRCQADFGSHRARQLLTVATFLAQYLLPLLFTNFSYISIMKRLWYRSSGLGSTTPRQVAAQSRAKRKTIKMLVLTVICFAISWAPINIYHLLTHFSHVRHNSTAILICHMIAMSSSMYNPFIFCGLNEHFRREAVKWLYCFRTRRSPMVHPGTEVNGMLTRADQVSRRNMSTTVIHTTLSCRRSPQQLHASSPISCQRRRNYATTSATAVYMTPRRSNMSTMERIIGTSRCPMTTRISGQIDSSKVGSSPSGYQPELLFLVRDAPSSDDKNGGAEEIESMDDVNSDDFPDGLCDEWNSSVSCKTKSRIVNQSPKDSEEYFATAKTARDENYVEDEDDTKELSGELETVH